MIVTDERVMFQQQGYMRVEGLLTPDHLARVRRACDELYAAEDKLQISLLPCLRNRTLLDLIDHPPILDRVRAVFGHQTQLISYDVHYQRPGPVNADQERWWHRDLSFPGDTPVILTVILAVDDMPIERGPTHVVPGTHRGTALPPKDRQHEPLPGEVALTMPAGSAAFINGAIWHSKGHNVSPQMRRVIILGYGYWWLKRWFYDRDLPWQALVGASEDRLRLLGLKQPEENFHYYDPAR
jgi:hypothetical protein